MQKNVRIFRIFKCYLNYSKRTKHLRNYILPRNIFQVLLGEKKVINFNELNNALQLKKI